MAEQPGLLTASHGLRIQLEYTFADASTVDLLVIPGGETTPQLENAALLN